MPKLGVMEIFFGSPWPAPARLAYAEFLASHGYGSYLYGPKADGYLRKRWREDWPTSYKQDLSAMSKQFRERGVEFGVCFSPMGFHEEKGIRGRELLSQRLQDLDDIGLDTIGLFFDDMPVHEGLAETQLSIVEMVRKEVGAKILFCPSYYTPDPILEKVFGAKPAGYLETLAANLPAEIEIAWTGPKVISPEISAVHLQETSALLKRAPSLCDNFFANDGPKNCKLLKLRELRGRSAEAFAQSSSWYFNPMNQPYLSRLVLRSAQAVLVGGKDPDAAWAESLVALCSPALAENLLAYRQAFLEGLDKIDASAVVVLRQKFAALAGSEPMAAEVRDWLDGAYNVGSECLTD
jgi:hyaluronoglucosaminidase